MQEPGGRLSCTDRGNFKCPARSRAPPRFKHFKPAHCPSAEAGQLTLLACSSWTQGRTPLHVAAQLSNVDCVRELLRAKASVDATDGQGNLALHIAAEQVSEQV